MKKFLLLTIFKIIIFSNLNANEIDLNDPYYKLGWKNIENPLVTSIEIPNANASIEIIESEIYLDTKEDIKNYEEYLYDEEISIDDINNDLIISDKDQYYTIQAQYYDEGYITTDRFNNFTPKDIMETFKKRKPDIENKITWILEPTLTENKISNYGYRVDWSEGNVSYIYYSNILGREGYLELKMTLMGDGTENEDFFNFYQGIIEEVSSTVKFNDQYKYSDFIKEDYISNYTLTNIIDGSWGEGVATDLTNIGAYCLITTGALKKAGITEADYPRFAGKVITFYITEVKSEIMDISSDDDVSVLSGMYGIQDKKNFQKLNISPSDPNTYDVSYTNIIELVGDKATDKVKYEYKNKLVIKDGIPKILFAKIDQTGLSFNKWNLTLGCRDHEYTAEEIADAKEGSSKIDPKNFKKLIEKLNNQRKNNVKVTKPSYSSYSLLIEEDGTDFMIIYRYPKGTSKMEGSLIYNSNYEYAEFFEKVYKNGPSENILTSIQPNQFGIDGELEDYLSPEYIIDDFNFTYITRMGDYILNFETKIGMERISSYIDNKESFSLASLLKNEAWHASTFKILSTIDDFKNLAKNNPNTLCSILWEPLIKNLNIKELNEGNLEEELNNNGITKSSLGCK